MNIPQKIPESELPSALAKSLDEARVLVTLSSSISAYFLMKTNVSFSEEKVGRYDTAMAVLEEGKKPEIIISRGYWESLTNDKQRAFLISHEVDHIFLDHMSRAKSRKEKDKSFSYSRYNKAADYYINLVRAGYYYDEDSGRNGYDEKMKKYLELIPSALIDTKFANMSADEIYEQLPEDDGDGQGDGNGNPLDDLSDSVINGDPDTIKADLDKTLSGAYHAAQASNSIGKSEGNMVREIEKYFQSTVDYRDLLDVSISSSVPDNQTYKVPSLLSEGDVIYPSEEGEHVSILFGTDSSGSMSKEDYQDAASAIYGIISQFDSWELDLVTCDIKLHEVGRYDSESEDSFEDVDLNFVGGGGTDLSPIAEAAMKRYEDGDEIDACIIVTDGYIPESIDNYFEPSIKNIVLVTKGGNKGLRLNNAEVIFVE